jgi:hypothetical protein
VSEAGRKPADRNKPRQIGVRLDAVNFDLSSLVCGLIVSSVGFVLFQYGRKMSRAPHVAAGLALLVFPYFVPGVLLMFGIAAVLCGLLLLAVRAGY